MTSSSFHATRIISTSASEDGASRFEDSPITTPNAVVTRHFTVQSRSSSWGIEARLHPPRPRKASSVAPVFGVDSARNPSRRAYLTTFEVPLGGPRIARGSNDPEPPIPTKRHLDASIDHRVQVLVDSRGALPKRHACLQPRSLTFLPLTRTHTI